LQADREWKASAGKMSLVNPHLRVTNSVVQKIADATEFYESDARGGYAAAETHDEG
jgi:hypothetical protein